MNSLELLKNNPKSALIIKQWFLAKLLNSLNDTTVPDDFKEFVKAQDLENDKIATMINASPRMLFDVFDKNKVYIQITYYDGPIFWCSINGVQSENKHNNRIAAEEEAIEGAFTILEAKL